MGSFEVPEAVKQGFQAESITISAAADNDPVAVIVFHGMGEQVRYETLGALAKSLLSAAGAATQTTVTMSRLEDTLVARAEISWEDAASGYTHEAHFYEAYWAPITEGQVTYYETLRFLVQAAWTGFRPA